MSNTPSIDATEMASAAVAVAVAPRVTADSMKAKIKERYFVNAFHAVDTLPDAPTLPANSPLRLMTLCILVMENGFVIIGKTAPASPENFNQQLGEQFSFEDALRQLWPLEGYALRERLARDDADLWRSDI